MIRLVTVFVLLCGAMLFGTASASAHTQLESSDPPADSTLEYAPIGVGLVFNQSVNENFATVSLVGPDGEQWSRGETTVDGPNVSVLVEDGLPNGVFTVGYRVTSADGHPVTGSYTFTVDAASAATSAEAAPVEPTASAVSAPEENASAEQDSGNSSLYVAIAVFLVAGIAAAGVTFVRQRRNKS